MAMVLCLVWCAVVFVAMLCHANGGGTWGGRVSTPDRREVLIHLLNK